MGKYKNWRSDEPPQFKHHTIEVSKPKDIATDDRLASSAEQDCLMEYHRANQALEFSVGQAALSLTRPTSDGKPGPLLQFASEYSRRYLDLYEAYAAYNAKRELPMIPVTAGQMKLQGFTDTDILKMQRPCQVYGEILKDIKSVYSQKKDEILDIMTDAKKREEYIKDPKSDPTLVSLFTRYHNTPDVALLDKAHFLMINFGHMGHQQVEEQFYYVAEMKPIPAAKVKEDERILMEIRHRVAGDSSIAQNSLGTLGHNPLAYLNAVKKGEPGNPEAEFREKMYFVYMNNHFANTIIQDPEAVKFVNQFLANKYKDNSEKMWSIDTEFVEDMLTRGPAYLPPVFRYGANAAINRELRGAVTHEEVERYHKEHPNLTLGEAMEGNEAKMAPFNLKLSNREIINQTGDLAYDPFRHRDVRMNFGSGAAVFKLVKDPEQVKNEKAKEYINVVNDLNLPVVAGISGTLDQSTMMAGIVGIGIDENKEKRKDQLEIIRMAYLGFMLPGKDHSVHEIMQSSATYGLDYTAGPGFHEEVFTKPELQQQFSEQLLRAQKEKGYKLPEAYLTEASFKEKYEQQQKMQLDDTRREPLLLSTHKKSILEMHSKNQNVEALQEINIPFAKEKSFERTIEELKQMILAKDNFLVEDVLITKISDESVNIKFLPKGEATPLSDLSISVAENDQLNIKVSSPNSKMDTRVEEIVSYLQNTEGFKPSLR